MQETFLSLSCLIILKQSTYLNTFFFFRLAKYQAFKNFSKRIMVATDLFGRGMDIERVNIVFNYDMPENSDTYLHRVRSNPKHLCPSFLIALLCFLKRLHVLDVSAQKGWLSHLCRTKAMRRCSILYKIALRSI